MKYKVEIADSRFRPLECLHFTTLLRNFVVLIEKDGGIRPCDVLATCTYKVLHSTQTALRGLGQISEGQLTADFSISKN